MLSTNELSAIRHILHYLSVPDKASQPLTATTWNNQQRPLPYHPFSYPIHVPSHLCQHFTLSASLPPHSPPPTSQRNPRSSNPPNPSPHSDLTLPLPLPLHLPDLPTHVKEKILSLEIMGIDSGRALSLNPDLRDASLDSIHSLISFLQSKGIHPRDFPRIFAISPRILTSSIHYTLAPVFAYLSKDLKVPNKSFRRVINKCPKMLVSSVKDQLKPALIYLQGLGITDTDALAYQYPVLLVSRVEKTLIPKLEFLKGLGLSREEAAGMVVRCPGLFTFSVENNFKPKYEYFEKEMDGCLEELKEFPQYFAFSLAKRIKPRHQEMVEAGVKLSLPVMLKCTDKEFREMMQSEEARDGRFLHFSKQGHEEQNMTKLNPLCE